MKFILIETSTPHGGVCFYDKTKQAILFEKNWSRKKLPKTERHNAPSHSELVGSYIEQGLTQLKLTLSDFDFFATTIGPGSFTGVRVGINVVKSFCFALNKPLYSSTLLKPLL